MKEISHFERIVRGDKKAFNELFLNYYQELCRFAFVLLRNKDDSEEVVQKLFIRLWEKRKSISVPENTRSFLYKSVYNESLKLLKSNSTRAKYNLQYALYAQTEGNEIPESDMLAFLPHLKKGIESLPSRCREIFILNKLEGFTQKEISEILNISTKTVENQIAIAVAKLRAELKPYLHLL